MRLFQARISQLFLNALYKTKLSNSAFRMEQVPDGLLFSFFVITFLRMVVKRIHEYKIRILNFKCVP